MTQNSSPTLPSASDRAEAAAWVARLHGSERSRALEEGFKRWLQADPAHPRAFEAATEAWDLGGSIARRALPRIADPFVDRPAASAFARRSLAVAAALSVLIVGALLYLYRGDVAISTEIGEQRMLTLEDGTRIILNTDTRIAVEESRTHRHVRVDIGEVLFEVTKDPARPFVVAANGKQVVALGTAFMIRSEPQELAVTLMEGKVAVSPASALEVEVDAQRAASASAEVVLAPGQRITFSGRDPPHLDQPSLEVVTAWRRGEIILDNTRLQDAVREMNRYSALQLEIDPAVADRLVSGIFRTGDSARFAHAVAETYQLAIEQRPRRILISGARR